MNHRWLALADRIDALNRLAARLGRWALLLMLALGTWNVVGRYVGLAVGRNLSSNALIEGQWQLFDLMFLLSLGYALQTDDHVRVDVLQSRWSPRRKVRVELAGEGRIFAQDQLVGFSADLSYAITRNETFAPYLFGRAPLFKDKVGSGAGLLILEEATLAAGRAGAPRRGLEGAIDAGLKAFGL